MLYIYQWNADTGGAFSMVHPGVEVNDETGACRQVAVKVPHRRETIARTQGCDQWDRIVSAGLDAFAREQRLLLSLPGHPNVVKALGAVHLDGHPALVLEYIHGPSLTDLLADDAGPLPALEVLDLLRQGTCGLSHLEVQAGIAHGDLFPRNVLYDGLGSIKIADFGLAISIDQPQQLLSAAVPFPPEERDGPITGAGDVWRLGLTVCFAALGQSRSRRVADQGTGFDGSALVAEALETCFGGSRKSKLRSGLDRCLNSMLRGDVRRRPGGGTALAAGLHADPDLVKELRLLQRRDLVRQTLHGLCAVPRMDLTLATIVEAAGDLERLVALTRPRRHQRPLPDDDHLLARAYWRAWEVGGREQHLQRCQIHARQCLQAHRGDVRVHMLLSAALRGNRALAEVDAEALCQIADEEVKAHHQYGSFKRNQHLKRLCDLLTERLTCLDLDQRQDPLKERVAAAIKSCQAAVKSFDHSFIDYFNSLEDRLQEPFFTGTTRATTPPREGSRYDHQAVAAHGEVEQASTKTMRPPKKL